MSLVDGFLAYVDPKLKPPPPPPKPGVERLAERLRELEAKRG